MILIFVLFYCGCEKQNPPVSIGFTGTLTGTRSILSSKVRNGAILAVEDINTSGGINGRSIELIVKDNHGDPQVAVKVLKEFILQNAAAIIGPIHSEMCLPVLPLANNAKRTIISVAATSKLTGIDDCLFRINPPSSETSVATAQYAFRTGMKNIAVLYDLGTKSYAESKYLDFKQAFEGLGGITTLRTFTAGKHVSYPVLARQLADCSPDGFFLIAGPIETALICQHLRNIDSTQPIMITAWAYHPDLLNNGGKAVEGVVFAHSFFVDSRQPAYLKFQKDYLRRYKVQPGMWDAFGYECIMVLADALSQNPDPHQLKQTILKIGRFKGLQGDILFDRFGDNRREPLLLTVRKGAFVESN